jgi:hypothetical protein
MGALSVIGERRATRVVVAVLALVVPSASCALIVGDVEGRLLPSVDAAAPPGDADAALPEAMAGDATIDATAPEASATADGSAPAADGANAQDAGDSGTAPAAVIHCARSNCPAVGSICCLSNVFDSVDGGACSATAQCFAPSVTLFCASASDCAAQGHPGDYCCGSAANELNSTGNGFVAFTGAQCLPSCPRSTLKQVLCDPSSQTEQCGALDAGCTTLFWQPSGYYSCQ